MMVKALIPVLCGLASLPALCADSAVAAGLQRAAASPLRWEIREAGHPVLGPIRFAVLKTPVTTQVSTATLASNVYVSCEKNRRRIAIELTNATSPTDPEGLQPAVVPRLVCHRPTGTGVVQEELNASWEFNKLGDALSRGLATFPLRECAAISVKQEVLLPPDWGIRSARIEFEISPYARELDEIFVACGETAAYRPGSRGAAGGAKSAPRSAHTLDPAWKTARTVSSGMTNVRAKPRVDSALVTRLYPGDIVLVQQAEGQWWRIKPRPGAAPFEGYVRVDRLTFK